METSIAEAALTTSGVEEVYAGVDWISCTLPKDATNQWYWVNECRKVINEIAEEGYKLEARSLNGYVGMSAGGSFYGVRDDGAYIQVSSHRADMYLERLYRSDLHISRLDVQVTVRFKVMPVDLGRSYRASAVNANDALQSSRRRRIWNMEGNDGGYTLYIGSASSDQRCRIYNKAVQSEDPAYARCWRYEVVFRNLPATEWAIRISAAGDGRANLCANIVAQWLAGRGVTVPWWFNSAPITLPLFQETPSDAEKKLSWLRTQVRPAVRWLFTNGFAYETVEAIYGDATAIEELAQLYNPNEGG